MGACRARRSGGRQGGLGSFCLVLALLGGCGGRSADDHAAGGAQAGSGANGDAGSAGSGANSASGAGDLASCQPEVAPLRRLTNTEYANTLRALFDDPELAVGELPLEPPHNYALQQVSPPEVVDDYFRIAKDIARSVTSNAESLAALAPCAGTGEPSADCTRATLSAFANRALRRAASSNEVDELVALQLAIHNEGGSFAQAFAAVIAALLQSPEFLYRIEFGTGESAGEGRLRLSDDELATRLSYLFWQGPPDSKLRAAADSGALRTPEGVQREAQRLFDDPRAHAGVAAFFDDFLLLRFLARVASPEPEFSPALAEELRESTQRFLTHRIFDQHDSWPSLITAPTAFVNQQVASYYGVPGITGDDWREVELDTTQRLGLFTQPSLLIVAGLGRDNPTRRGLSLLQNVLCRDVPPDPPNLPAPPLVELPSPITTRERWTLQHSGPLCAGCHHDMDQLGFALLSYDALGRYRSTENGLPIDTKIDVLGVGPTDDATELVQRLAALPETQACFAKHFAQFALAKQLGEEPADACLARDLARRFEAGNYDVKQLLLGFTQTPAFLYLPEGP